jgi:hypothetical protein
MRKPIMMSTSRRAIFVKISYLAGAELFFKKSHSLSINVSLIKAKGSEV